MAGNVTLSSSVRENLLSLQNTSKLISQTQGRLSTGLKVATPVDDPVAYFQAKSLNDRATDFREKKDGIAQGISTVTSAMNAVDGIESLVKQLKGLALTAKSATTTSEIDNVVSQFNDLKNQINKLASDASYQGLNLVNGSGSTLTVNFSNDTASALSVASKDLRTGVKGLNVNELSRITGTGPTFNFSGSNAAQLAVSGTIKVTLANSADLTVTADAAGTNHTFVYGSTTFTYTIGSTNTSTFEVTAADHKLKLSAGGVYTFTIGTADGHVASAGATPAKFKIKATGTFATASSTLSTPDGVAGSTKIGVGAGFTETLNNTIASLEKNLTNIRSIAQQLGSNIALLQTRLDFTNNYVNTLTAGAGKLSLADLNEEGANLLALQTRQQLSTTALSLASQASQAVLRLFQ